MSSLYICNHLCFWCDNWNSHILSFRFALAKATFTRWRNGLVSHWCFLIFHDYESRWVSEQSVLNWDNPHQYLRFKLMTIITVSLTNHDSSVGGSAWDSLLKGTYSANWTFCYELILFGGAYLCLDFFVWCVCVFLRDTHNIELFTDIKQYIFKSVKWTLETSWSGSAVAT